jgi:hypothetical protein
MRQLRCGLGALVGPNAKKNTEKFGEVGLGSKKLA